MLRIFRENGAWSEEDWRHYEEQGFLIFDPEIPPSTLDGVVEDLAPKIQHIPTADGSYLAGRIMDGWRISANAAAIARAPKVLRMLEEFYGRTPLPFQTLNFSAGTEQRVHTDTIHFNSDPAGFMCGVWVALEDMDEDNGPLIFYPRSHTMREYTLHDFGLEPPEMGTYGPNYEAYLDRLHEEAAALGVLEPKLGLIKKGQALIWHANLLHGGSTQRDKQRTRHSQVTHYFFEGCRYWTPLWSRPGAVHYRDPQWVAA